MTSGLFDLTGKTALVTGARTGLGQGIALALAEAGADIAGLGSRAMADTAAAVAGAGRRFVEVVRDLEDSSGLDAVVADIVGQLGRIDILVNNAGIIRRADLLEFSEADWDAVMSVNLKSAFFLTQAVARHMVAQGIAGRIIHVASLLSFQGASASPPTPPASTAWPG